MYVIVNEEFVVLGPMEWRPNYFRTFLLDEFDIDTNLPLTNNQGLIIWINENLRIMPVSGFTQPAINSKLQQYAGPFYNFLEHHAEGYYTIVDKSIDTIKNELKDKVPAARWTKEVSGFKFNLQGTDVWISTERSQRSNYANGTSGSWKFRTASQQQVPKISKEGMELVTEEGPGSETWITVTSEDLQSINAAIQQHVQSAFDWEQSKISEINSASTVEELDSIVI